MKNFGKGRGLFNKRFALHQGTPENPKVRAIDDCKRSGLNSAYTTTNKLELLDVDVLARALISIADAHVAGWVELGQCDNEELSGPINAEARKCLATKRQRFKGTSILHRVSSLQKL